jgi:branched-chain amino acid transport system permease protein
MISMWGQVLINGIVLGGIYGFVAIGLAIIFGTLKVVNFAHGSFLMLAMYSSYWQVVLFGIDPYLSTFFNAIIFFPLGFVLQRFFLSRFEDMPFSNSPMLITMGLMIIFENMALYLWTGNQRFITTDYQGIIFHMGGGLMIGFSQLVCLVIIAVVNLAMHYYLTKTDMGKATRAISDDKEAALLMGIDAERIYAVSFGLGMGLLGVAGGILLPLYPTDPSVGHVFLAICFAVVIMGGAGQQRGVLICGLLLGLAEGVGAMYMPGSLKSALPFVAVMLVLLLRPSGLFAP